MTQRVSAFCVRWRVRLFPFNSLIISRISFKPRLTFSLSRLGRRERERLRFSVSQVMQYKSLFRPRLKLFIYTKAHCVYVWSCRLCLPATGHLILYYWMRITAKKEPLTYTHMWPVHRGPPHTDWWTKCVDRHWDHSGELI